MTVTNKTQEPIEVIPKLQEKGSLALLFLMTFAFKFGYVAVFIIVWFMLDWLLAFFVTLLYFIISTILLSKIRQVVLGVMQNERDYKDFEIIHRFLFLRGFR